MGGQSQVNYKLKNGTRKEVPLVPKEELSFTICIFKMHLGMENLNSYHYLADFHETLIRVPNQNNEERISLIQGKKQNKTKTNKQTGAGKTI